MRGRGSRRPDQRKRNGYDGPTGQPAPPDLRDTSVPESLLIEYPDDLPRFRLPDAVKARLDYLLDRQDAGHPLTAAERDEAEGLVTVAEMLSLLRMRAERAADE